MQTRKVNKQPLVSVIMPCYNANGYLEEAIKSILKQSYKNFELIIVNDGSTDESPETIKKLAKIDKRIIAIHLRKNQGESVAANIGYRKSKGEFIARMDADDVAYPNRLEKQVKFLQSHPQHILVGTQVNVIDKQGEIIGKKLYPLKHEDIFKQFAYFLPFSHPSIMLRRSLLPWKTKLWLEEGEPIADTYTFFHYIFRAKFANLPEILLDYRVHGANQSYQKIRYIYLKTIKFRLYAVKKLGYPFSLKMFFNLLAQSAVVFLLPEKLVINLFFIVRGIKKFPQISILKEKLVKFNKLINKNLYQDFVNFAKLGITSIVAILASRK